MALTNFDDRLRTTKNDPTPLTRRFGGPGEYLLSGHFRPVLRQSGHAPDRVRSVRKSRGFHFGRIGLQADFPPFRSVGRNT
jgi:hypothetical protein